ncbi:hypothetical protein F5Y16DRAFT_412063 [Xylariaceae sp. FL0255]|nr:hypothetical protein F5Y16DRAFT_412063 [Xylariaceae sp. FL0255]
MSARKEINHAKGLPYPLESTILCPPMDSEDRPRIRKCGHGSHEFSHIATMRDPFHMLQHINTLFIIDDSHSMKSCWDEVGIALRKIAPVCIEADADGIDIEFLNHQARWSHVTGRIGYYNIGLTTSNIEMHDNVEGIHHNVKPRGPCELGLFLMWRLGRYIDHLEQNTTQYGSKDSVAPLNVIVISNWGWEERFGPIESLLKCARKLDALGCPPHQLGIQFFRVGQASAGVKKNDDYAIFLDDRVWKQNHVRVNMVDVTTWTGRIVVLGAMRRSLDFQQM